MVHYICEQQQKYAGNMETQKNIQCPTKGHG